MSLKRWIQDTKKYLKFNQLSMEINKWKIIVTYQLDFVKQCITDTVQQL